MMSWIWWLFVVLSIEFHCSLASLQIKKTLLASVSLLSIYKYIIMENGFYSSEHHPPNILIKSPLINQNKKVILFYS